MVLEDLEERAQIAPNGPVENVPGDLMERLSSYNTRRSRECDTYAQEKISFISYIKEGKWSCVCFPSAAFFRILVAV